MVPPYRCGVLKMGGAGGKQLMMCRKWAIVCRKWAVVCQKWAVCQKGLVVAENKR